MIKLIREIFLKRKAEHTLIELIRYTFVGGFAFVIDFSMLFVLTDFFGIHYLVSAAIAFIFGLSTNYVLSILWVFDKRSMENRWMEFMVFTVVGIVGLGLNEIFLWVFTGLIGIHYLVSKIISTVFVFFWNFIARKLLLFNRNAAATR